MSLENVIASVNKKYGSNSLMMLSSGFVYKVPTLSTGILQLDISMGVGGLPRGRIIELYGPESSGKTSVCLTIIAQAQNEGLKCAFIDTEQALDLEWAKRLGVNIDELPISQPDCGEDALGICEMLVDSKEFGIIVVDSVAAMTPRAEIEGEIGASHVGLQARMMGQAMRKLAAKMNKTQTMVIFTNQIREKIGITYGSNETTPGGRALRFYASVRLDVRRTGYLKEGSAEDKCEPYGATVHVKIVKSKVSPPFRECDCSLIFNSGFDEFYSVFDLGVSHKIIKKAGSWFSYEGQQLGQGRVNVIDFLKENTNIALEIREKIKDLLLPKAKEVEEKQEMTLEVAQEKLKKFEDKLEKAEEEDKQKYAKLVDKYTKLVDILGKAV